jgi:polyvinyl alcohol dehydrogenase (cytochrome)
MYALDASTGKVLWGFASGGAVIGGAAIANSSVFWGSGYYVSTCPGGSSTTCGLNNKLYAFSPK